MVLLLRSRLCQGLVLTCFALQKPHLDFSFSLPLATRPSQTTWELLSPLVMWCLINNLCNNAPWLPQHLSHSYYTISLPQEFSYSNLQSYLYFIFFFKSYTILKLWFLHTNLQLSYNFCKSKEGSKEVHL